MLNRKIKKYLLTFGTLSAVIIPVAATTACSYPIEQSLLNKLKFETIQSFITKKINDEYKNKKNKVAVKDVIEVYFNQMKGNRAKFIIHVNYNDNKITINSSVEVTIQANDMSTSKDGILQLKVVELNTSHIYINSPKQNKIIDKSWTINEFEPKK